MFKCAFLGCGPRARGHALAYRLVKRGQLAAVCDQDESRLQAFGDEFGIGSRYTDLNLMLEVERPDVLHIITPPTIRHSLMSLASERKVPAVIVEKPVGYRGEDYRDLLELSQLSATRFVVNTQLHFHPRNLLLKRQVSEGAIGDIRLLDASARSTPIDQGPHVFELTSSYAGHARPATIFGQIAGAGQLESRQPSPEHATASMTFENGIRAALAFGTRSAPKSNDSDTPYRHKRIAAYGTRGFVHWTMVGWEWNLPGRGYESGEHTYAEEDALGQAGLTEAVFDWLEDPDRSHPTRLERSLLELNAILGMYVSALTHQPMELPCTPPENLIETLRNRLT